MSGTLDGGNRRTESLVIVTVLLLAGGFAVYSNAQGNAYDASISSVSSAEAAGINVEGEDKWKTLIQNASRNG
jgi:hypothetical protein